MKQIARLVSVAAVAFGASESLGQFSPLALEYSVSGSSAPYTYSFTLRVTNDDGSWRPGHSWGWLVIGDVARGEQSPLSTYSMTTFPSPWTSLTRSSGTHNGWTLAPALSGWTPSSATDSISWTATSDVDIPQGQLLFSTLYGVGNSLGPIVEIERQVAQRGVACPADLDDDGNYANGASPDSAVTVDDLIFFLQGFEEGDIAVDVDENGANPPLPDGAVTIDDLIFFLIRFEGGC